MVDGHSLHAGALNDGSHVHMGTMVGVPEIVVVTLEFPCFEVSLEIFGEIEEPYSLIIR